MTTAPTTNGKPQRKQLSHQLDRLDRIIDVMVDDLPDAVAAATRDGTRQAIRAVLTEVLTDPDVLARLRATLLSVSPPSVPLAPSAVPPVPPSPAQSDRFARLKAAVRSGYHRVVEGVKAVVTPVKACVFRANRRVTTAVTHLASAARHATTIARVLGTTVPLRRSVTVALAAGVMLAGASYLLPHPASAALSGVGGAVTSLALQLGVWLHRTARSFSFPAA